MKIAYLTPSYGGQDVVGRHVRTLAEGVARAGGDVEVLLPVVGRARLPPTRAGVSIICYRSWTPSRRHTFSNALLTELRRRGGEFDILHVHGESMLPALLVASGSPRHLLVTPHFYASSETHLRRMAQGRGDHLPDRQVLGRAECVCCVSHSEALLVRRYAPRAAVQVVPNGSDALAIAAALPQPVDRRVILSVDRLTRWAGIHRVISALPALPASYTLVVVGRGRARGMLEAHADYLGVGDRVRFLGGVSNAVLGHWLQAASVVATLKEESLWGGTLLAAACASTPVVCSDIPAHREAAVLAGGEGFAFVSRRASPFAVAEAIAGLVDGGSQPMAALVPTWADLAEETLSIYREVLSGETEGLERTRDMLGDAR